MKILHLFANWKWTGPAEPALNVARCQVEAHDVLFLSGTPPDGESSRIVPFAEERGVPTLAGFHLSKHARWRKNREDVRRLTTLLSERRPDVVHCHLDNDHRIASLAVQRAGVGRLVRTSYDTEGLDGGVRVRRVARRALDGLIVTTRGGYAATLETYDGSERFVSVAGSPRPLTLIETGVDLSRFEAGRYDRAAYRERLGLAAGDVAVGIVARVQTHRRFDLLLDALEPLAREFPQFKLVAIGRGTKIEELLHAPVRERGLEATVLSPGYLSGDDYPGTLSALDATLFLVPGSDGTCRALREQMAMGLAPLVTPRAPLPEIVDEGTAGLVVEETVDALRHGLRRIITEESLRERLGRGAAEAARQRFDMRAQAAAVTAFYERVLARSEG